VPEAEGLREKMKIRKGKKVEKCGMTLLTYESRGKKVNEEVEE
jgi:hypothetical protein